MWVEELKNGKFKYVERYKHPLTGKYKKTSLVNIKHNARVEKEMFIRLQEKIDKIIEDLSQENTAEMDMTFKELTKIYLRVYKKQTAKSTLSVAKSRINTINEVLGKKKLADLSPADFNKFLLDEFDKGLVFTTVNSKKKLIGQILTFAAEYGYISDYQMADKIKVEKINKTEKADWKYLERYELAKVVNYFKEQNMHEEARLCQIQASTGMRFNELAALDYKKHVDFKKKLIFIDRSYDKINRIYTLPKGNKKRTIHVNDDTLDLIQEQIKYDQLKMMSGKLDRKNTLLFRTRYDNPYPLKGMNEKLHKIKLDSKKHLTTHIFRHTFITLMVEAGVDSKAIAEHVGHSDTKMIDQVYSHLTETMDARMEKAIKSVGII